MAPVISQIAAVKCEYIFLNFDTKRYLKAFIKNNNLVWLAPIFFYQLTNLHFHFVGFNVTHKEIMLEICKMF